MAAQTPLGLPGCPDQIVDARGLPPQAALALIRKRLTRVSHLLVACDGPQQAQNPGGRLRAAETQTVAFAWELSSAHTPTNQQKYS